MSKLVLLLGGNEEKTKEVFNQAAEAIGPMMGPVLEMSRVYKSPPWGFESPCWFLNQVIISETSCTPFDVLSKTQQLERQLGRKKKTALNYESRLIDIDILFYADVVIDTPELQVPHPRLHLRRFTLEPLNELMPDYEHPLLQKNIKTLLKDCPDKSDVFVVD